MPGCVEVEAIITPRGDAFDYALPRWGITGTWHGPRERLVEKLDRMLRRHAASDGPWRTRSIKA